MSKGPSTRAADKLASMGFGKGHQTNLELQEGQMARVYNELIDVHSHGDATVKQYSGLVLSS
jgi:hypothetical protein